MTFAHTNCCEMVCVLFLAVTYLLLVGAANHCPNATTGTSPRNLYFSDLADLILHGYGYRTLAGISVISCGNLCLSDTRCFSINYSERDKVCELNGATASQYPPAMVEWGGSYYYGPEKPGFVKQLQIIKTKIPDSHHSASDECQGAGKHLCQPWELLQAYKAGKYQDIPTATSFWYSALGSKVLVNATGLTYQEYDAPDPIIASQTYTVNDRDGQAQACSDLDAHLCTLPELNEAYLRGYRQPDSSQWFYFSIPNRDARLIDDGCNDYSECYEGVVSNTPRPDPSGPVICCPVPSSESSSPAMCCPGLISPRDPIITEEVYAKEDRDGMASACSALQAHLCTLAELKEAYLQGYRQPFHQPDNVLNSLWLYFAEPNRDAKLYNDECAAHTSTTGPVVECYGGIVAHTPRPDDSGRAFCCPQLP